MKDILVRISALAAVALVSLASGARESVVFVEAHPDDLAGSMGTALLLSEHFDVHVIDFTHGERGLTKREFEDGSCKRTRTAEETAVCAAAGFSLHWCDQVDGTAFADQAVCEQLRDHLMRIRPRAVFCHWPVDTHADHVMSAAATLKALQMAKLGDVEVYFHEQDGQSRGFKATHYVNIDAVVRRKAEIVSLYACQGGPDIAKRKAESNRVYGRNSGTGGATEVFAAHGGHVTPGKSVFDVLKKVLH